MEVLLRRVPCDSDPEVVAALLAELVRGEVEGTLRDRAIRLLGAHGGDDAEMDGSWSNYPYFESGTIAVTSQKEGLFLVRYRPRAVSQ